METNLTAAKSQLAERERQLAAAEEQLEKTRQWVSQELIARKALDQAQHTADTARAQMELAQAHAAQQEAMLAQSRKVPGLTRLTAPFGGLVTDALVKTGSKVGDSDAVLTIASLDILKASIRIPRNESSLVREGMTVRVRLDDSPADVLDGTVTLPNLPLEPGGDTVVVEVHVPNRNGGLKPGTNVSVSLSSNKEENVLFVPLPAVLETGGKDYVYTVIDGRAQRKDVFKHGEKDGKAAIEGLREGEQVVVWGQQSLSSGGRVRLLGAHETQPPSRTWLTRFCPGEVVSTS
jgi:membrane fusion protein (multidrug efflux system)